jgi:hypothetical protein
VEGKSLSEGSAREREMEGVHRRMCLSQFKKEEERREVKREREEGRRRKRKSERLNESEKE